MHRFADYTSSIDKDTRDARARRRYVSVQERTPARGGFYYVLLAVLCFYAVVIAK